ncbi:CBS domain-containing protein [Myroides marinus]|uniref:CBS domain-containing protein n=1 Tax=Myroides marinus TaxID=703342 RepID=UPI00257826C2|nr:CBS domain-containing protein [Myroides marinus]MDM1377031.1 CBS domain-containing protein [Myroides marinus]
MGYELWYSQETKHSRRGTTFSEIQSIFINNVTTNLIFESLACCKLNDNIDDVKNILLQRDFDTLGVIDPDGHIIGFIVFSELGDNQIPDYIHDFKQNLVIKKDTPIDLLLELLLKNEFLYVSNEGNKIEGIITRADINKPIVRIYLFGIISLFEMHLNYWINKHYPEGKWNDMLAPEKVKNAQDIYSLRKGNNSQLTLLECLQLSDKKTILFQTKSFIDQFSFSKTKFKNLLEKGETIRNELAHSQNSIINNLQWEEFVETINTMKHFLDNSEKIIRHE